MEARWEAVDAYIGEHLLADDPGLTAVLANNGVHRLPPIDVSPAQGKLLYLLAQMAGARRILEVGTLGGYSTIWLARALPEDGRLITLEVDRRHAEVARENLDVAGVGDKVEILVGPAHDSLATMADDTGFDFIFIDADKQGNPHYMREAMRLGRSGATIIVDNVVRAGGLIEPDSDDPRILATRALFEQLKEEARIDATAVQTVGAKGWDGFLIARLR
ncbi:O-methyltransferase [Sphingopyxis sp. MWB1]|uniref:O-methyltransferase n=1 Tax=Sphingopyxis sp. MWB1 TaxID=1537715 RepID=UPI00051A4230|nr:O-methyltransferase [Sphingopyxis sp. MWB1]